MIAADITRLRNDKPSDQAHIIDGQPLPQAVLEEIICNSALAGTIYDTNSAVLWQGRTKRLATDNQWNQLIIRDQACVICDTSPAHCEAHHLTPYAPPTNTNIDLMVLICPTDHHLAHDSHHQLTNTQHGWQLQPQHRKPNPQRGRMTTFGQLGRE